MPTTPWTRPASADTGDVGDVGDVHVVATEFHLPRLRDTPAFLRATREITRQMATAHGLVGYALQAGILSRTYRTVSAWRDPADARAFARSGAHARVASTAPAGARPSSIARWDAPASDPPPSWERVEDALRQAAIGVTSPIGPGVGSGG